VLVAISLLLLNHQVGNLTQLYASNFSLQHLSLADSITLLGFSAYLGWLGACSRCRNTCGRSSRAKKYP